MGLLGEVYANAGLHIDNAGFAQYAGELTALEGKISSFSTSSQTMMAGAFAVPAVVLAGVVGYGTQLASSMEDASTTLTTVYGDLDTAKEKFTWLADFAASTPFEFPELLDASVKLKAYGIDAQEYMGTIGDAASAMGKPLNMAVEAVADAMTGEFERMKEFGIKAVEITKKNASSLGASLADVGRTALTYVDANGKQQLEVVDRNNRAMIMSTVDMIWSSKYEGAMAKRSQTLSGLASTLKDNLTMSLADMVGFDMQEMEVQSASLLGVFKGLVAGAVELTSGLTGLSEPMEMFIVVAALGVAGASLLAAGFTAYGAILPAVQAAQVAFGVTLSASIWPVTAVVAGLALLAAGLVYLEEKTGIVSTAWQIFSDTVTIVWAGLKMIVSGIIETFGEMADTLSGMLGEGFLSDIFTGLMDGLGGIGEFLSDIVGGWHNLAESVRGDTTDTNESIKGVGTAAGDTATTTETGTGRIGTAWDNLKTSVVGSNDDMAKSAETSAKEATSSWDDAIKKMYENKASIELAGQAGLENNDASNSAELQKGIQGKNGDVLGINNDNEIVIQSVDGITTKFNELNGTQDTVFQGVNKNYAIMIDDGTRSQEVIDEQAGKYRSMGNEVRVVKTKTDELNGSSLSNITSQQIGLTKSETDGTYSLSLLNGQYQVTDGLSLGGVTGQQAGLNQSVNGGVDATSLLNGTYQATNGISLANVNGQLAIVDGSTTGAAGSAGTMNSTLAASDFIPFSTLIGNLNTTGGVVDTNTGKTSTGNSTFGTMNASPFGSIQGNLSATGGVVDANTGKTNTGNSTFGTMNASPFGTIIGNLNSTGGIVVTNTGKTQTGNSTFGTMNSSPFGTIFGNLGTIGTKVDTNSGKSITGNGHFSTMGSFSFGSTISGLGGISGAVETIISKAKDAISWLSKLGSANANANKAATTLPAGSATTIPGYDKNTLAGTNIKIGTINNNGTSLSNTTMKSVV